MAKQLTRTKIPKCQPSKDSTRTEDLAKEVLAMEGKGFAKLGWKKREKLRSYRN